MNPDVSTPPTNQPTATDSPASPATPPPNSSNKPMKMVLTLVVILLVVGVVGLIVSHHHKNSTTAGQSSINEVPEGGKQTESELNNFKQEVTVEITADGIAPQTLNISKDTRINWMNKDTVAHKLAITPGTPTPPEFDNNHQIDVGGGYPFVIHQAGTFHYYLVDKPTQSASVIVK